MNGINAKARVTEVDSLSDALVRIYKALAAGAPAATDMFLATVMAEIERLSAALTTAVRQDAATSTLDDADGVRDEAIRALGALLTGYAAIPIAAKRAAAEALKERFDKYGVKITKESYANESSLIESLLEDLVALPDDIAALDGVSEAIAALRAAQDAFNAASDEYTAAKTGKGESATALKKPLVAAINDRFVPYLTAVGTTEAYKDFAAKVEAEIGKINAAINARGKK